MKRVARWAKRLAVVAALVALVARILKATGSAGSGRESIPTITGDTWPPVPLNPARRH